MNDFLLGLDLGQAGDHTALALLHRQPRPEPAGYHLRHAERFALGMGYPDQVRRVASLLKRKELAGNTQLIVDATGVGRPVVELFEEEGLRPIGVWITGGDGVSRDGREFRVPKRELASSVQALLQSRRLRFAHDLKDRDVLREELKNFRVKVNIATGHDRYEHHREGDHDDLVLALAMACWYAEYWRQKIGRLPPSPRSTTGRMKSPIG